MADFADYSPKVVLAVGAHADDIDFGASGSVAKWARDGADVHYLVITDGSKGTEDRSITSEELANLRQKEQRAAAKSLGAKEVHFLGYEDGALEVTQALKKDIVRVIRQVRPDTVVVMDPTFIYSTERGFINHPDHRAAGQATLDAIFPLARDHKTFPDLLTDEGLEPHKVEHVLLVNFEKQNFFVDITETLDAKIAALQHHASQISDMDMVRKWITERAEVVGKEAGVKYAESFVRLDVQ
ncbi:MAG TPA: PIG-L deacetylase family protein [Candidatus Saccharimonadales bacterium]|nr:PIG-L deacetylase family protein [Candidatus Saccharimonadales bacterium]